MRRITLVVLVALPWFLSSLLASAQSAPQYEIRDLIKAHDLENESSGFGAFTITDEGVVVGFTGQSPTKSSPFYTWTANRLDSRPAANLALRPVTLIAPVSWSAGT